MKHRVGAKVVVKNVYSGGNFENGDIVAVSQIGSEDEKNCYGAVSPHDGFVWFLYEDEVEPATNADHIRTMTDEELAELLTDGCRGSKCSEAPKTEYGSVNCYQCRLNWLTKPVDECKVKEEP